MVMGKSQHGVQIREASGALAVAETLVPIRNVDSYNRVAIQIRLVANLAMDGTDEVDFIISTSYDAKAGIYNDSTANTAEALDDSDSVLSTTDGTVFEVGDVIRLDAERMIVTAIATNDLTVERGAEGTARASHATALDIFLLQATWVQLGNIHYGVADNASAPVGIMVIGDDTVPVTINDVTAAVADDTVRVLPFSDRIRLSTAIVDVPSYNYEAYASFYKE